MYYIGIDLGTSACKLLLVDEAGRVLRTVTKEYLLSFPRPGWSEQDPALWWAAVCAGTPELLAGFDAEQVAGIGAGGQMHGLAALDGEGNVIRPAILWNDGRTQKQTDWLNETVGRATLSRCTANIAFAGFTAPKLLWMRENEPELFARIAKILLPKDYVVYALTGRFSTDVSDASGTLLLDVKNRRWSAEMCRICGVDDSVLPPLHESGAPVGRLKPELCGRFGLSDVTVAAGAGDNAAAAVGTGTVGDGGCTVSLGTSGTVFVPSSRFFPSEGNALHAFCHADGGYHLMGCILSAAACNQWWMDILAADDFAARLVHFHPHLFQTVQVQVDGTEPDVAPAGIRRFRDFKTRNERSEHKDGRAHLFGKVVRDRISVHRRGVHDKIFPLETHFYTEFS